MGRNGAKGPDYGMTQKQPSKPHLFLPCQFLALDALHQSCITEQPLWHVTKQTVRSHFAKFKMRNLVAQLEKEIGMDATEHACPFQASFVLYRLSVLLVIITSYHA